MPRIVVTKTINAPAEDVFRTVADIREFSQALPHIMKYEILTDCELGVGTRFRETRLMQGKTATTELEITEYDEPNHVRIVADSHGAVWDSVYTVREENGETELTMTMDAKPYKLMQRIMIGLICKMIKKYVDQDMELVKSYCEGQNS